MKDLQINCWVAKFFDRGMSSVRKKYFYMTFHLSQFCLDQDFLD